MEYFTKLFWLLMFIAVFLPKLEGMRIRTGIRRGSTFSKRGPIPNQRGPLYIPYPSGLIDHEGDGYLESWKNYDNFQTGPLYAAEVPARIEDAKDDQVDYDFGRNITLTCTAHGFPRPSITWWKNGNRISPEKYNQVYTSLKNFWKRATIEISPGADEDVGYYECRTSNVFGDDSRSFQIDYVSVCDDPCDSETTKRLSVIE